MSFVRVFCCFICCSFGILLFAAIALPQEDTPQEDTPAGSTGANSVETNSIETDSSKETKPVSGKETNPVDKGADDSVDACMASQDCIDAYLWSLYERTPKIDTVKVPEQTKATVKRKGKTKTVTKTITKLVTEDFAWKDPDAAEKAGMSLTDYVIGGMDPGFKVTLYRALRALDDAGLMPGIMCAFRDDYRQTIATGLKAQSDRSFHGGSFRGGYGHGQAVDIVSVKGDTRMDRLASSQQLWEWIDKHEKELGIGRPYLDRDPPHVGLIDGEEYAVHRLKMNAQYAASRKPRSVSGAPNATVTAH